MKQLLICLNTTLTCENSEKKRYASANTLEPTGIHVLILKSALYRCSSSYTLLAYVNYMVCFYAYVKNNTLSLLFTRAKVTHSGMQKPSSIYGLSWWRTKQNRFISDSFYTRGSNNLDEGSQRHTILYLNINLYRNTITQLNLHKFQGLWNVYCWLHMLYLSIFL